MATDIFGGWYPSFTEKALTSDGSGGGGGGTQVVTGSWDNPNGHTTPNKTDSAAIYVKDVADGELVKQWGWSVANQSWFAILT